LGFQEDWLRCGRGEPHLAAFDDSPDFGDADTPDAFRNSDARRDSEEKFIVFAAVECEVKPYGMLRASDAGQR
jgi:hypothetical protein